MTKWNIREEDYSKIILTDAMKIYIIEIGKFKKYQGTERYKKLDSWIKFIENPEVIDMSNKEIVMAKKVLDEISQDEHERYLAEMREKYILDQNATEAAGYDKRVHAGDADFPGRNAEAKRRRGECGGTLCACRRRGFRQPGGALLPVRQPDAYRLSGACGRTRHHMAGEREERGGQPGQNRDTFSLHIGAAICRQR